MVALKQSMSKINILKTYQRHKKELHKYRIGDRVKHIECGYVAVINEIHENGQVDMKIILSKEYPKDFLISFEGGVPRDNAWVALSIDECYYKI